nr:putative methyltransferase-like c25b8.10 [Quercus suber]
MATSVGPSSGINHRAQSGFAKSAAYDENRATYPPTATQHLLEQLRVAGKQNARILDLAAGTGIFTAALASRDEQYEIIAVEPHDGMRDVLEAKKLPRVTVRSGVSTSIPLDDASVDAIVVAQAFHWFSNMESLREIHRVLKTHGCLGLIWNIESYNAPRGHKASTSWEVKAHELIWSFDDNEPRFRHEQWRKVFDEQTKSTPLSLLIANDDQLFALPLGEDTESFEVKLTKEKIWERFATLSQIAVLEGEDLEKTLMDALNADDVEVDEKNEVAVHGETYTAWTSKIPTDGRETLTDVERIEEQVISDMYTCRHGSFLWVRPKGQKQSPDVDRRALREAQQAHLNTHVSFSRDPSRSKLRPISDAAMRSD